MKSALFALTIGLCHAGDLSLPFGIEVEYEFPKQFELDKYHHRAEAYKIVRHALFMGGVESEVVMGLDNGKPVAPTREDLWRVVPDVSLDRGFEVVSPVDPPLKEVETVMRVMSKINAQVDPVSDFHVHVDASGRTVDQIRNVYKNFLVLEKALDEFQPFHHRANLNEWLQSLLANFETTSHAYKLLDACQTFQCLYDTAQKGVNYWASRRYKLNLNQKLNDQGKWVPKTFEFRGHHSTTDPEVVLKWIKLTNVLVHRSFLGHLVDHKDQSLVDTVKMLFEWIGDPDVERVMSQRRELMAQEAASLTEEEREEQLGMVQRITGRRLQGRGRGGKGGGKDRGGGKEGKGGGKDGGKDGKGSGKDGKDGKGKGKGKGGGGAPTSDRCTTSGACASDGSSNEVFLDGLTYDASTGKFEGSMVTNGCLNHASSDRMSMTATCTEISFPFASGPGPAPLLGAHSYSKWGIPLYGPYEAGFVEGFVCEGGTCDAGWDLETCENQLKGTCTSEMRTELLPDECGGHAGYHYHFDLACNYDPNSQGHSALIGIAGDGYGVYGMYESYGVLPELDTCNGHTGPTPGDNDIGSSSSDCVYHYHTSSDFPWTVGCYGPVDTQEQCESYYDNCAADPIPVINENGETVDYEWQWCPCKKTMSSAPSACSTVGNNFRLGGIAGPTAEGVCEDLPVFAVQSPMLRKCLAIKSRAATGEVGMAPCGTPDTLFEIVRPPRSKKYMIRSKGSGECLLSTSLMGPCTDKEAAFKLVKKKRFTTLKSGKKCVIATKAGIKLGECSARSANFLPLPQF